MDNIVLYCKSYHKDVERVKILLDSILQYNMDNIPFYISVPSQDIPLFKQTLGTQDYILIADEDISQFNQGWLGQQVVKSQFWKLNLSKNYLCLDSDTIFIKDFYVKDFVYKEDIPYTIIHEQQELFTWAYNKLSFDIYESFKKDRLKIMQIFNRTGKFYDFGPSGFLWSNKVWEDLENNYITPNNLIFKDLIEYCPSELTWYGESLLAFNSIPIYPSQPLFKMYHYQEQYLEDKSKNVTLSNLAQNYLGVILQSNWGAPLYY